MNVKSANCFRNSYLGKGRHHQPYSFPIKEEFSLRLLSPCVKSRARMNPKYQKKGKVSLRERLYQVTWGWYSMSMATGGIAVLLYNTPHQFTGLETIGKIVYIFNLVLFLSISLCLSFRFLTKPSALKESFQHSNETHFVGTCLLAFATIIIGAESYVALRIVFWIYVAISIIEAIFHNWYLYHHSMATMLSGTIASVLASKQPPKHALPIIIGGTTLQGFGFLISLFIYGEYFYRLNKSGLPKPSERPEMFIAVGPWSFTALALIGMANAAVEKFPARYIISYADSSSSKTVTVTTGDIALVVAALAGIFLWAIAFFCLCIAIASVVALCKLFGGGGAPGMSLPYWSMVFPNTGLVIATIRIGQVAIWLIASVATIWAVWTRRMLWPEDAVQEEGEKEWYQSPHYYGGCVGHDDSEVVKSALSVVEEMR
ncbi:voltage-dependent anion channel-domain-containing protein [Aspergillus arachidicola]|uniref:Voltage-dependent anion channel-domain-containing protein n=1 Tax=Aspergillus arachidicola TaxID=656916 RepID=A0A5N6YRC6_9EURO|nr:voltage-dependent anion channel-domain-containing protein [Aspergillus arachidicola]